MIRNLCIKRPKIVDDFGFDPVVIGRPANGLMLEPGGELFGASETKQI